ncbi:tail-anchored protein insertion receptor WRB-like [Acanthaster planci]|uniref:Guided entry of tail-anchored proteins factor 1 n=1 Tax=Acanthaster planci TaxID=133434 RepID=A0A8B7XPD6_ACAPL|nr:tail-anchored protein insertion receptor WRB-like [Acanthaster planci]
MAASMIVVFFLVVILQLSGHFIPFVVKQVMKVLFQDSEMERSIKVQMKNLVEEQSKLHVKEEFPKFARIDRKINKLRDELKKIRQSKTAKSFTISWGLTIALNSLQTVCLVSLIWMYRYEPLLVLNEDWFWPLSWFIAFPSGVPGAIGITCWILICNNVLKRGQMMINAVWMPSKQET